MSDSEGLHKKFTDLSCNRKYLYEYEYPLRIMNRFLVGNLKMQVSFVK
jgi:hypothetical protein